MNFEHSCTNGAAIESSSFLDNKEGHTSTYSDTGSIDDRFCLAYMVFGGCDENSYH